MQLITICDIWPHFVADPLDGCQIERSKVRSGLRVQPSTLLDCPSTTLFQGCVVQKSVGSRVQYFLREGRRLEDISGDKFSFAFFDRSQKPFESAYVHRLFQTIANRLIDQWVIGNLDVSTRQVFGARDLVREHRAKEILSLHALELRGDFFAAAAPQNCESAHCIPAPSHLEHRRRQQGLNQQWSNRCRAQILKHLFELKTVSRSKRKNDRVFGGCRLQLEVELPAKALSKRKPPRAI